MKNILLVEPAYRSKFPPLGLLRISTYHKESGDLVFFVRGKKSNISDHNWDRIYISSLFTYELPRTVDTIKHYSKFVRNSSTDIYVGGIGATLLPDYIRDRTKCKVIVGPLDKENMLGLNSRPISTYTPDYDILTTVNYSYYPSDSYYFRVSVGCIRKCKFCAVPIIEPSFGFSCGIQEQAKSVVDKYGEKQNMVIMDNNILALYNFGQIINEICDVGFVKNAKRNNKKRYVDFNQGIDARLITTENAKELSRICLHPIRLAFDFDGMEKQYKNAIKILADHDFKYFTNYIMFNFNDTPASLYHRLKVGIEVSQDLNIHVTGFPMRYIPIFNTNRGYVSKGWCWRYLRGIQCILNATHGVVSPNQNFFLGAFGDTYEKFLEIISMPDRYIMYRNQFADEIDDWREKFISLSEDKKQEFINYLSVLNKSQNLGQLLKNANGYSHLLIHYYPKYYEK